MPASGSGEGRLQETGWFPQENTVGAWRIETCRRGRAAGDSGSKKEKGS